MEKMKHTPGPWLFWNGATIEETKVQHVLPHEDTIDAKGWTSKTINIGSQNEEILAVVKAYTTTGFLQDFDQWEANAILIRAAPDLLEALESCLENFKRSISGKRIVNADEAITHYESALRKARGL